MNTEQHMDDLDNLFLGLHKKISERQTKAGNQENFQNNFPTKLSHAHSLSLSLSICLNG